MGLDLTHEEGLQCLGALDTNREPTYEIFRPPLKKVKMLGTDWIQVIEKLEKRL